MKNRQWLQSSKKITIISISPVHSCCWSREKKRKRIIFISEKKCCKSDIGREAAAEKVLQCWFGVVERKGKALTHATRERWKIREKLFFLFSRFIFSFHQHTHTNRKSLLFVKKKKIVSCCMCQSGCVGFFFYSLLATIQATEEVWYN